MARGAGAAANDTDERLMLDVRRGSREAFEVLFERYRDAVWRFYRRRLSEPARAEELVQDVFVAILQNSSRYEPRSTFRSYLFGIAFNALKAERRRAGHRQEVAIEDEISSATPNPDSALWVRRALATLEPEQREIVMLREYEGLSYQEISGLLHLPLNTVRSRLFRARMDLKDALSPELPNSTARSGAGRWVQPPSPKAAASLAEAESGGGGSPPFKKVGHESR